jgi:hypothetical protein
LREGDKMITANGFYGTYFHNKIDSKVKCTCCGKSIVKGYTVAGMNLGEDCHESIKNIFKREIAENSGMAKAFNIQKMHFDWIRSA